MENFLVVYQRVGGEHLDGMRVKILVFLWNRSRVFSDKFCKLSGR